MRILLFSAAGDGAWLAWLLAQNHDVTYLLADERYAGIMDGICPKPVQHIGDPSSYDCILFDLTGFGSVADEARTHAPTLGDSSFADLIEHDRIAGIEFMEHCGIKVPAWEAFDSPDKALSFIRETKKRYVFKPVGPAECSATYVSRSSEDLERYLEVLFRKTKLKGFVLQEFVDGTEVSTEMWMSGGNYFCPNHTLEEKKFLAGNLGPNVGCAGSVVWMGETHLFEQGLKRAVPELAEQDYVGPIDLNSIVTEGELYGIEWTPRFGYDATANLTRLLPVEFGEFLHAIAAGRGVTLGPPRHRFAAAIRLSVPIYPVELKSLKFYQEGVPVDGIDPNKLDCFYLSDVRLKPDSDEFETAGVSGLIGCPIGCGDTIYEAFEEVKAMIKRLRIPDLQWRTDVPETTGKRFSVLESQGWLRRNG